MKHIALSSDHAGYELKQKVKEFLVDQGYDVTDYGPSTAESMDYPDAIHPLARAIDNGEIERGIIICGSGNGVAMTANKYANVRAGIVWTEEIALLARQHNDANVLSLPARFITDEVAIQCVKVFLSTVFEGGRHAIRVNKITKPC